MKFPLISNEVVTFYVDNLAKKFPCRIGVSNSDSRRFGFKIKSSRPDRYIISPALCVLNSFTKIEVLFYLMNSSETKMNINEIRKDRFCLIFVYLEDENITKDLLGEYMKRKDLETRKVYLSVVAIEKYISEIALEEIHGKNLSSNLLEITPQVKQLNNSPSQLLSEEELEKNRKKSAYFSSVNSSDDFGADLKNADGSFIELGLQEGIKKLTSEKKILECELNCLCVF